MQLYSAYPSDDVSLLSYQLSVLAMNGKATYPIWIEGIDWTSGLAVKYNSANVAERVYIPVTSGRYSFCEFESNQQLNQPWSEE
jgi:hypothetical protein